MRARTQYPYTIPVNAEIFLNINKVLSPLNLKFQWFGATDTVSAHSMVRLSLIIPPLILKRHQIPEKCGSRHYFELIAFEMSGQNVMLILLIVSNDKRLIMVAKGSKFRPLYKSVSMVT